MIKAVKAISYKSMLEWKLGIGSLKKWTDKFDNVFIIHITEPGMKKLFADTNKSIVLEFLDIDLTKSNSIEDFDNQYLFNEEMANKIVKFLLSINKNENSNDLLLINCMAGISRSGAVAWFARILFNLDYDTFMKLNPHIVPNQYVLSLLFNSYYNIVNS